MKRVILAFLFSLLIFISVFSQETKKIDEFGQLFCDDAKARTDMVAIAYYDNPGSKIYMIFYTGKRYRNYVYDKKLKYEKEVFLYPQIGEAKMNILRWKNYLTRSRRIPEKDIVLVDGGFREEHTLENWIVPKGAEPPKPSPTLTEKDIKFRKGRARYIECDV